jgi:hypothetical protein
VVIGSEKTGERAQRAEDTLGTKHADARNGSTQDIGNIRL